MVVKNRVLTFGMRSGAGDYKVWSASLNLVYNESWYHVVVTQVDANTPLMYINGVNVAVSLDLNVGSATVPVISLPLSIGRAGGFGGQYHNGSIDEVRISNVTRNASWIRASFNNQNQTPGFLTVGSEQDNSCPHHAYWSSDNVSLKMTGDVEFSCSNYTNISAVDALNKTTNATSKDYTHHHFLFNISEDPSTITNVDVNWHGYSGAYLGGAKPKWYWDATMYFNTDAPGWYTATSTTLYTTNPPYEEWLNYTLHHDINDWLDDNGILEIAIQNTYAGQPSIVHTDYIEVVVTYRTGGDPNGTYCTNNVSWWNNGTCEQWWTWNVSVYDGVQTTDETFTFQNMPCILSAYVYPMNQTTGICPCCDAMCFGVGGLYGNINATVYRSDDYNLSFYMVENYTNITNGTYCFCIDGHIDNGMYRPMRYNTTYYWYVYAENYYNNSMNVTSSIFHFTTAEDVTDCSCDVTDGTISYVSWYVSSAVGLMGLLGLICIPILLKRKKEDEL